MASIRKRGDRWHVQVRRKGHPPICKAFGQRKDADVWARETEGRLDRGESVAAPAADALVADLLLRYADTVSPSKRGGQVEQTRLRAMARQSVAKSAASKLSTPALAIWRDERLREVSPGTVIRELGLLHRVMVTARHEWSVPVALEAFTFLKKPKAPQGRVRRVPARAAAALLDASGGASNPFLRPAVVLALETGMRRGEIVALQWDDVDLGRGLIHIRAAKNGHGRTIPATVAVRKELSYLRASGYARPFATTCSAIHQGFERARGRAAKALQAVIGAEERVEVQDALAALRGLRFHDLRHEAISGFFEKGLTMVEAAEVSGHRTLSMLKRYAHADLQRIAAKLGS